MSERPPPWPANAVPRILCAVLYAAPRILCAVLYAIPVLYAVPRILCAVLYAVPARVCPPDGRRGPADPSRGRCSSERAMKVAAAPSKPVAILGLKPWDKRKANAAPMHLRCVRPTTMPS